MASSDRLPQTSTPQRSFGPSIEQDYNWLIGLLNGDEPSVLTGGSPVARFAAPIRLTTFDGVDNSGVTLTDVLTGRTAPGLLVRSKHGKHVEVEKSTGGYVILIHDDGIYLGTVPLVGDVAVTGTLDVSGQVEAGNLVVVSGATVGTTLDVTGAITGASTLDVAGQGEFGSLNVVGAATVGTTLDVTGAATVGSTLAVAGQLQSTYAAGPPMTVASSQKVVGFNADLLDGLDSSAFATAAALAGYLPLTGGTITGSLDVDGNLSVNTNFDVDGTTVLASATIETDLLVQDDLTVAGDGVFQSGVTIADNLAVDTDTLFVDATGHTVGIAESTPDTTTVLHIGGLVRFDGTTAAGKTSTGDFLQVKVNGNTRWLELFQT